MQETTCACLQCLIVKDMPVFAVQASVVCKIFCKTVCSRQLSHTPVLVCNSGPGGALQSVRTSNSHNLCPKVILCSLTKLVHKIKLRLPHGHHKLEVSSAHSQ